jgi:hypothetical protein
MSITGKTIAELPLLNEVSNNTLFPVEYLGTTFNLPFSAFSYSNYTEVTYSELVNLISGNSLNLGTFYLITDFQTCYDQPDFDYNGNSITGPNTYHTSTIEPILVLATSNNTLSPDAYQPTYPNDKIKYDYSFDVTESTGNPAKGRITERIDDLGNRTDYDHRTILFKRYRTYFQDGTIAGRIIGMNNGIVTGLNTNFTGDLITGNTILIYYNSPKLYEVIEITSPTDMVVAGFNYDNFSDSIGYRCERMFSNQQLLDGCLYYFNDVGNNDIDDGGDDMYDGGNRIYTNLFSDIPYTHTQMTDPPVNNSDPASFGDFVYDGSAQNGDLYFGLGSSYFTNTFPGLFVMAAYNVSVTDFEIDGNLGSDGDGQADTFDYTLTYGGSDFSVYCKRVWGAQDPSVTHIYIVNTIDGTITHNIDTSTEDDLDTISNLTGVTQIHYLLFALAGGIKSTNSQIQNVVNSYLSLIDYSDINYTLSILDINFTSITSNLPANQVSYKSLNFKQSNITGDTENYQEHLTFGSLGQCANNYIGNYANLYSIDSNPFILSNNVFYGTSEYLNNTFGDACFNNTFDDDCTENIIGNYFYNNLTDDDFDQNIIGNYFYNNYITANFQRNEINYNFYDNTITIGSFYRNNIGNDFSNNIITGGDFQNNQIGNQFNNNKLDNDFYKNTIGNGYNDNRTFGSNQGNKIGNGFNNNQLYSNYEDNVIGDYFGNNTIGDSINLGSYNFYKNNIAFSFSNNTIQGDFRYNQIANDFSTNSINNSTFQLNEVKFGLNSVDFSLSTHVYANYNCTIFLRSDAQPRLSYYDSTDTLLITDVAS